MKKIVIQRKEAIRFIVFLGIVSLFADVAYEGARSITGPFLLTLGASGALVGLIVGLGELMGYGVRLISGYVSDQTKKYWSLTFLGYFINLAAVPLLALAGNWKWAAFWIILERFGKGLRTPARDSLLSFATKQVGKGWGFGLHESLDQIGAVIGPLLILLVLAFKGTYREGFLFLAIPGVLAILQLTIARFSFPTIQNLERSYSKIKTKGFSKKYWTYLIGVCLASIGFTHFALISFHFQKTSLLEPIWIAFVYALAMGVDGLSALLMGRLLDRKGVSILVFTTLIASFFAPIVFFGGFSGAIIGMVLWGIGLGTRDSILRAMVAYLVAPEKRGSAYGLFYLALGGSELLGNLLMGALYDISAGYLVIFSLFFQLLALPFFHKVHFQFRMK